MKAAALFSILLLFSSCIDDPSVTSIPGQFQQEYQLLWNLFDRNYVGFALSGVDWNALFNTYMEMAEQVDIREKMTEMELLLLENLCDRNIKLISPGGNLLNAYQPDVFVNCDSSVLMSYLIPEGFQWIQQDIWGYCIAGDDSVPYFVVKSWSSELNLSLLDNILQPLSEKEAMILDIRLAEGHSTGTAHNLARRFAGEQTVGHMTQRRVNTSTWELTAPAPVYLIPRGWFFQGEVILLAGQRNSGISEVFACDMSSLPSVTLVGDTTAGSGNLQSLVRQLPDGWYVTCPTVTLLTSDTVIVENTGVLPDVAVNATAEDFQNGSDPVLEKAFSLLEAQM
ncbi:hypothetical protein CSA37_01610 [Candidatus Fermentibacteria bacterium]|nr:MAG: hypothetical protein CSA37_13520 [Candidatus Fermentibacteria bacterium]PIE53380.1 MAG: hypothetical protein CSA37_01610 [Candidatus Fermentibacteria bacterium]